MERRPLSKRTRFEIFKRDGFRCLYCGATPLQSPLHVDHVQPVSEGGTDEPFNLVTACSSCNLGKAAVPLERRALAVGLATEAQKEQAEQILQYLVVQSDVARAKAQAVEALSNYWLEASQRHLGSDGGVPKSIKGRLQGLLDQWPIERLVQAIDIATAKGLSPLEEIKYFYGILRQWRGREEPAEYKRVFEPDREVERLRQANEELARIIERDWDEALEYDRVFGHRHLRLLEFRANGRDPEDLLRIENLWLRDGMVISGRQLTDEEIDAMDAAAFADPADDADESED